jgi:hypothetical protein
MSHEQEQDDYNASYKDRVSGPGFESVVIQPNLAGEEWERAAERTTDRLSEAQQSQQAVVVAQQAVVVARQRFYVRTVGDLLTALANTCESANDTVTATTPHGTYTFEIANVHQGGAGVVLALREIPAKETK